MARVHAPAGWKFRSRTVTDDQSVLAYVQWNPRQLYIANGTTAVTASRMQTQANQINFDLNGVADTQIGTYTGNSGGDDAIMLADAATVQGLLNLVNGLELGIDRYMGGLGDFRPGFVIGAGDAMAVALANILLGWNAPSASCPWRSGLEVFADSSGLGTANTMSVGCGTGGTRRGGGQAFPAFDQTEYTSTVAGVTTYARNPNLSRERFPQSTLQVRVTSIHFGAAYATNAKILSGYDQSNNLVWQRNIGSATDLSDDDRYNFENPIFETVGPAFVEGVGTGALTDGPLTVGWYERVA